MQSEYQKFGCQLMQRNAIARVIMPIFIGTVASLTALDISFVVLFCFATMFSTFTIARVILIIHGRRSDIRILKSIEDNTHTARKLRTSRRAGDGVTCSNSKASNQFKSGRSSGQRFEFAPSDRVSIHDFRSRLTFASTQKNSTLDSTRRTPG